MLVAKLILLGLLGQLPGGGSDLSTLTTQLGSRRYAERESASEDLERLGRQALPALRAARDAHDLEIRHRAFGLIQKIEGALLTQSSSVRLDFKDATLVEVMRSLSQQAGFKVALLPENLPKWKYQRVTLRRAEPVPFWEAIDQLCDAAQLQYNLSSHGVGMREPTFILNDGAMRTVTPNSDHGPFRVSLLSVDYERHVSYSPSPVGLGVGFRPQIGNDAGRRPVASPPQPAPVTTEQFTAHLIVAAEPRLSLSQVGVLQMLEAVDDRSNSLLAPGNNDPAFSRFSSYIGVMNASIVQVQAPLRRPAVAGETIKKLRGLVPLAVSSRRPDPLVVPLDQGAGKRFENSDVELIIQEIRTMENTHQKILELSVRPKDRGSIAEHPESDGFVDLYRPDSQRQQIEILDSRGLVVPSFSSGADSEPSHLTLTVSNSPVSASLKELRYYTLTRTTFSVPFEFKDIPMP